MITFATFHVENKQTDVKAEVQSKIVSKNIYHLLLELLFRSASVFHPACSCTVLSNQTTAFDYLDPTIKIFRTEVDDRAPLMFSRLAAQIRYIKSISATSNLVFLDSDILINGNLNALFEQDFDIALTYRDNEEMPINWGAMFISTRNQPAAVQFLERVLENYRTKYFTNPIFWCDQYALMDTIQRDRFFDRDSNLLEIEGARILLVPCETYNFSPENKLSSVLFELKDKQIIHFKGARKRFIQAYWQTYLEWREPHASKQLFSRLFNRFKLLTSTIAESSSTRLAASRTLIAKVFHKGRNTFLSYRA